MILPTRRKKFLLLVFRVSASLQDNFQIWRGGRNVSRSRLWFFIASSFSNLPRYEESRGEEKETREDGNWTLSSSQTRKVCASVISFQKEGKTKSYDYHPLPLQSSLPMRVDSKQKNINETPYIIFRLANFNSNNLFIEKWENSPGIIIIITIRSVYSSEISSRGH